MPRVSGIQLRLSPIDQRLDSREQLLRRKWLGQCGNVGWEPFGHSFMLGVVILDVQDGKVRQLLAGLSDELRSVQSLHVGIADEQIDVAEAQRQLERGDPIGRLEHTVIGFSEGVHHEAEQFEATVSHDDVGTLMEVQWRWQCSPGPSGAAGSGRKCWSDQLKC